jgi:hypothetical protein
MSRGPITALAASALAVIAMPAAAHAAEVKVDRACYPGTGAVPVKVNAGGFTPGGTYTLLLNGGVTSSGSADAAGNINLELDAPPPPETGKRAYDAEYKLEIRQGSLIASTAFRTAQVFSDFNPGSGDPLKLRVRFSAFGFGVATAPGAAQPEIFVHYVSPKGRLKKTISLGRGQGACGSIRSSKKLRLFPFKPSNGRWTLQFDTKRKYTKGKPTSRFPWDSLSLDVSDR